MSNTLVILLLTVLALLALDRALLWMEGRGWIYYRKNKPRGGAAAKVGDEAPEATRTWSPSGR